MTSVDRSTDAHDGSAPLRRALGELHSVQLSDAQLIACLQDALAESERAFDNLQGAVASSRRIGAAIGIVMSAMKVTEDDAFAVLSKISQRQNRKLRLVADDIVLTGTF